MRSHDLYFFSSDSFPCFLDTKVRHLLPFRKMFLHLFLQENGNSFWCSENQAIVFGDESERAFSMTVTFSIFTEKTMSLSVLDS